MKIVENDFVNSLNVEDISNKSILTGIINFSKILLTFSLTTLAWIFFRAENISHAIDYIAGILSTSLFQIPDATVLRGSLVTIVLTTIFIGVEWMGREGQYAIEKLGLKWKRPLRYAMYYAIVIAIFWFGGSEQQFIYFQF